jgi:hypothetical protein
VVVDAVGEIVIEHEPTPFAEATRAKTHPSLALTPTVTFTVPVGAALPDAGKTLKLTVSGFSISAVFGGSASPLSLEEVEVMAVVVATGFGVTVTETLAMPVQPFLSVAVTVNGNVPVAAGVPETRPVLEMLSHDGAPPSDQVSGVAVLPVAANCCEYATPSDAARAPDGVTVITGQVCG